MRVMKLEVSNFMKLEAFYVEPEGNSVVIRGANTEGKTSVCDAIFACLKMSAVDLDEPVHNDAEQAVITLKLGERGGEEYCTVERTINADGKTKLRVRMVGETKAITKPQELIDSLLGTYTLDPKKLLDQRPQDMLDDILKVYAIPAPVQQVTMLCGEEHPLEEGESADQYLARLSADKTGHYYVRRLEIGRECDTVRGAIQKQQDLLTRCEGALLGVEDIEKPEVIQARLEEVRAKQELRNSAAKTAEDLGTTYENARTKLTGLQEEEANLAKQAQEIEKKLADVRSRIGKGNTVVTRMYSDYDSALATANGFTDYTDQIKADTEALSTAIANQDAIIAREQATARMVELEEQLTEVLARHKDQDRILEDLRTLRRDILAGYDLGIEGLTVENGHLRLNDKPFKQASQAERLMVACAVAMKGAGELKLLRIDEGEALDSTSRDYVLKLAEENGFQVIMAVVADNKGLEVEIMDGE